MRVHLMILVMKNSGIVKVYTLCAAGAGEMNVNFTMILQ